MAVMLEVDRNRKDEAGFLWLRRISCKMFLFLFANLERSRHARDLEIENALVKL